MRWFVLTVCCVLVLSVSCAHAQWGSYSITGPDGDEMTVQPSYGSGYTISDRYGNSVELQPVWGGYTYSRNRRYQGTARRSWNGYNFSGDRGYSGSATQTYGGGWSYRDNRGRAWDTTPTYGGGGLW